MGAGKEVILKGLFIILNKVTLVEAYFIFLLRKKWFRSVIKNEHNLPPAKVISKAEE